MFANFKVFKKIYENFVDCLQKKRSIQSTVYVNKKIKKYKRLL